MRTSVLSGTAAFAARVRTANPVFVLAPLCLLQLGLTAWFAARSAHNGWVWYSGGDATEYWMEQWALGHLLLPQPIVGWGLPVLYAWLPFVAGPSLAQGLPVLVTFQALVLVPLALVLFWAVADRLYGRLFAAWASLLWVLTPVLLVWGFRRHDYREEFQQYFLAPHWYGLTNMADFPSVVVLLACAYVTLRACQSKEVGDAIVGGLLGGLLIGIKPANAFFLPAVAILLLATKRWRVVVGWSVALAPALLTLLFWKQRGLGYVPLTSYAPLHVAAGEQPLIGALHIPSYVPWDPHHLGQQLRDLREVFWSVRVIEYLAVAGAVGALRRSPVAGLFLSVWVASFMVLKGSSNRATIDGTTYFRLTEPGLVGLVLLIASIVFLTPRLGRRLKVRRPAPQPFSLGAVGAVAVVSLIPLALVLTARSSKSLRFVRYNEHSTEAVITERLRGSAQAVGARVRLSWNGVSTSPTRVQYVVFRAKRGTDGCELPTEGARECFLAGKPVAVTRKTQLDVPKRSAVYRIGLAANYADDLNGADLMLLGPPVPVVVG